MNSKIEQPKISYQNNKLRYRFDGFLPVVVDVETGGFSADTDALLEIAAILIKYQDGQFKPAEMFHCHILPFEGAHIDPESLVVNHIDPYHPFRFAIIEKEAIQQLFQFINAALRENQCRRAVLVGHNAHFDLGFLKKAYQRSKLNEKNPFHSFTVFDTATLSGLAYGKTVLAKALRVAGIPFDVNEAHSAIYDAQSTAELFCRILNRFPYKPRRNYGNAHGNGTRERIDIKKGE